MARTKHNCITNETSGKLGHVVFTTDGNMRSRPKTADRKWSQLQKAHLGRFESAKEYGRIAISDPDLNAYYAKKAARKHGIGAWHLAISDYCHPPQILNAMFENLRSPGTSSITIEAYDDFMVVEVVVTINGVGGEILESGKAVQVLRASTWKYELQSKIVPYTGMTFSFNASDLPGNITTETVTWPFDDSKLHYFRPCGEQKSARYRLKSQLRPRRPS